MRNYRMNNLGFITEIVDKPPLNAYELADELDWTENDEAAAMLRKQADQLTDQQTTINFLETECSALRKQIHELSN